MKYLTRQLLVITAVFFSLLLNAQDQYTWIEKSHMPAVGRHRSCGCSVNNRGYVGLGHVNNMNGEIIYDDWWEYDPGTDCWMQRANFTPGPRYHAVSFGIGNYAYVATGSGNFGDNDDLWRYSPATNTWQIMSIVPGGARSGAVAFVINGKGYVALGDFQSDCEEYDPATNTWTTRATSIVSGYSSVAAVVNNKAYVGVGFGTSWAEFNPATNTWTMKATFPGAYRFGSGCFSYNGWVYVVSGSDWSQEFNDSYAYNPNTDQWVQVSDFPGQARHYFVCMNIGQRVYGGTGTSGTNYNDWWEYGDLAAGINENEENTLTVFPNPVQDEATFLFNTPFSGLSDFQLYDASGKLVRSEKIASCSSWEFFRGTLPAGNYSWTISSAIHHAHGNLLLQ
jgi:N-acetylneuraminic acid mutarotase